MYILRILTTQQILYNHVKNKLYPEGNLCKLNFKENPDSHDRNRNEK